MGRSTNRELERRVQDLDREHPDWSAREIERELAEVAAVAYGDWRESTPEELSRLRAVQRWRGAGARSLAAQQAKVLFPYVWPLGERQRHELEPSFAPSTRVASGSWRVFLYNCSPETLREMHVVLDGTPVGYSPFLSMGKFTELHWQRDAAAKAATMGYDTAPSRHDLLVRFVIAKGTREARLAGTLLLEGAQGWVAFDGGDGRTKEIE